MKLFKSKYDKLTREEVVDAICQLEKELQGIESQLSEQQKRVDDLMVKGQKEKNKDKTILKLLRIPVQDFYNLEDLERKITEF